MDRLAAIRDVLREATDLLDAPAGDPRRAEVRAHIDEVLEQIQPRPIEESAAEDAFTADEKVGA